MDNSTRFPHMLKSEIFDGLDNGFKKDFLNSCAASFYKKPTLIIEQGEPVSCVSLIAHGYVDVTLMGEDGQHLFLARVKGGAILGESETISEEPAAASATTSANATILQCPATTVLKALQSVEFIKNMTRIFHRRLVYDNWVKHISQFGAVGQRLRSYLYLLSSSGGKINETQTYLASVVGCSRQTINRELSKLRDDGLIEQSGGEIIVIDREALGEGAMVYPLQGVAWL